MPSLRELKKKRRPTRTNRQPHGASHIVRIASQIFVAGFLGLLSSVALANDNQRLTNEIESFVSDHCIECHDSGEPAGDLDLEAFDYSPEQFDKPQLDSRMWEKMLLRIDSRQMPPPNSARPSELEYQRIGNVFSELLDQHATKFPNPGRVGSLRRLTRAEYQNSIRDLLSIDIDAADFLPQDESSHGFDNITVETLSPTLMNRYVTAAQKISRAAMGGLGNGPSGVTIRVPATRSQEEHVEGLPLGTRGGLLLKHNFPRTGKYEIELKLARDRDEKIEGLNREHHVDVLIDRDRVHRFTIAPPKTISNSKQRDFTLSDAHLKKRFQITGGPHKVAVTFPKILSALSEIRRQPFETRYNSDRHPRTAPAIYQVSIVGPLSSQSESSKLADTPSRRLLLGNDYVAKRAAQPEGIIFTGDKASAEAKKILSKFMRRAYRRPITAEDLDIPLQFFNTENEASGFEAGIESAITSVLVNPNFLFRIESEKEAQSNSQSNAYRINDFELASRLSYFLWSSCPDDELLELAEKKQLHQNDVLAGQVKRMLADPKSRALTSNFAAQWLYLRNLESIKPDLRRYPDFDDNLRQAFRGETEHLFEHIVRNDLSVLGLIHSDFTFLNQRLATHYGVPQVTGSHFRLVKLDPETEAGKHRGGILRHGSVLMVTSYATRTAPTIRGNWILDNLYGAPTPPPPPNIPNLKENTTFDFTSIRQRLAKHREDPACASCHDLIDPIGFSLENYDAIGRWRDFDEDLDVDSRGVLPDGTEIHSVGDLERGILKRPEMFARTLTQKLMTFAIGRTMEADDGPTIRRIAAESAEDDFRFSSIVTGIVQSKPFTMRSRTQNDRPIEDTQ